MDTTTTLKSLPKYIEISVTPAKRNEVNNELDGISIDGARMADINDSSLPGIIQMPIAERDTPNSTKVMK